MHCEILIACCLDVRVDVVINNYCKIRFLILFDGQIKIQCWSYKIIFLTGCSSVSLKMEIELKYRTILIIHFINFSHLFLVVDWLWDDLEPWSDLYELTLSIELLLSSSAEWGLESYPSLTFCSNFFLNEINEFPK